MRLRVQLELASERRRGGRNEQRRLQAGPFSFLLGLAASLVAADVILGLQALGR